MVCKSRVKTAVYISLSMASNLLGTDIPKDVLSKIQPNIMKIKLLQYWLIKVGILIQMAISGLNLDILFLLVYYLIVGETFYQVFFLQLQ